MKIKKYILAFSFMICFLLAISYPVLATDDEWKTQPIITGLYELEKESFLLTWEGDSSLYQVFLDGKKVATVNLDSTIIKVSPGRHQVQILPIKLESKDIDKNFSLQIGTGTNESDESDSSDRLSMGGALRDLLIGDISIGIGLDIDLAALGIDPKDILQGNQSKSFAFTYNTDPIYGSTPEIVTASTDFNDRVVLTIKDKYSADIYRITVRSGKDINYVEFDAGSDDASDFITKNNTQVTLTLDPDYLKQQGCMLPELGEKYSFSVILQKYAVNMIDSTSEDSIVHESKESKAYSYTPFAAWKNAPEITYASQTADGQILLQWEHEDNHLGCTYEIREIKKTLGVKRGEDILGTTSEHEFTVKDLMNGKHTFVVIPCLSKEGGIASPEVNVDVENEWVTAPELTCEPLDNGRIKLTWETAPGVESYHITVYAGSGSILRFVNLDFKKYSEFDVSADGKNIEYVYAYDGDIDLETGVRLKFEICGIRSTAKGEEQRSSVSTQTVQLP